METFTQTFYPRASEKKKCLFSKNGHCFHTVLSSLEETKLGPLKSLAEERGRRGEGRER